MRDTFFDVTVPEHHSQAALAAMVANEDGLGEGFDGEYLRLARAVEDEMTQCRIIVVVAR